MSDALGEATWAAVHPCSPLPLWPTASQADLTTINDKAMTAVVPNQRRTSRRIVSGSLTGLESVYGIGLLTVERLPFTVAGGARAESRIEEKSRD